jgi:lysophospholipase L1-like esterase
MLNMKLAFINLGTNDLALPATPTTIKTAIQTLITKQKLVGDVVRVIPNRGGSTYGTTAEQDAFHRIMYELASENDCPLINEAAALGSYAASVANGFLADTVHPNPTGNGVKKNPYAHLLVAA